MSEWNRAPGRSAADVNLDAAPFGFKVTGDAAWDSSSVDYAMFSGPGNALVAALVTEARRMLADFHASELGVSAWIDRKKQEIEAAGHAEVWDTMVRETIAYALDEAWQVAYGHRFDETGAHPEEDTEAGQ